MSKKSNPTLIGAFVVGAIVLLAVGVAVFGGSELLAKRDFYVAYFEASTKGLRVGSNVQMNGVRIGYVSKMALLIDEATLAPLTEVTIEVLPDTYIRTQDGRPIGAGIPLARHEDIVNVAGLRASLQMDSFVTGQLQVELNFRPGTEANWRGTDPPHPEIPTVPSAVQEMLANVQKWIAEVDKIDIETINEHLTGALAGLDELLNSEDIRETLAGINQLVNDQHTQSLPGSMDSTLDTLRATLADARGAIADARLLLQHTDERVGVLAGDLKPVMDRLTATLSEAEAALAAAKRTLRGESEQAYRLDATLSEIEAASRALRQFFDYLERNPESLLKGKDQ